MSADDIIATEISGETVATALLDPDRTCVAHALQDDDQDDDPDDE